MSHDDRLPITDRAIRLLRQESHLSYGVQQQLLATYATLLGGPVDRIVGSREAGRLAAAYHAHLYRQAAQTDQRGTAS